MAVTQRSRRTGGSRAPSHLSAGLVLSADFKPGPQRGHASPTQGSQGNAPVPAECPHPEKGDSRNKMGDLGILFRGWIWVCIRGNWLACNMQTASTIQPRRNSRRLLKRHNRFLLLAPRFCTELSFWFKHNRNCYQMCTSGPWVHWQALITMTSPSGPPPLFCPGHRGSCKLSPGPSVPAQCCCSCAGLQIQLCCGYAVPRIQLCCGRAVPGHVPCWSGQWPTDWISNSPWTRVILMNLSSALSSWLLPPASPTWGLRDGPPPCRPYHWLLSLPAPWQQGGNSLNSPP